MAAFQLPSVFYAKNCTAYNILQKETNKLLRFRPVKADDFDSISMYIDYAIGSCSVAGENKILIELNLYQDSLLKELTIKRIKILSKVYSRFGYIVDEKGCKMVISW